MGRRQRADVSKPQLRERPDRLPRSFFRISGLEFGGTRVEPQRRLRHRHCLLRDGARRGHPILPALQCLEPECGTRTQLAGSYSLGFASGYASSQPGAPWTQAYLAQTGAIGGQINSIQFLARGPSFALFVGGQRLPLLSLGDNRYAADISAFAGTTAELRFVNLTTALHDPVLIDNVVLSPVVVPEPAVRGLLVAGTVGLSFWLARGRRQHRNTSALQP